MLTNPTTTEPNVTTRDGAPVILFAYFEKQQRSYTGVFYNRDTWIACSWNKNGTYLANDAECGMDLVIIKVALRAKKKEAA